MRLSVKEIYRFSTVLRQKESDNGFAKNIVAWQLEKKLLTQSELE